MNNSNSVTIHTASSMSRQMKHVHTANEKITTQMRTVVTNKDFTEISAVKSLLQHFARFTALRQCR